MARKVEIANNLRAQQRNDIGTDRKLEARKYFFCARGTSKNVAAFEHQNFFPGLGEVGGVGETVMPSTNHDYVVLRAARRHNDPDCPGITPKVTRHSIEKLSFCLHLRLITDSRSSVSLLARSRFRCI